jgi:uncharacterized membrane protein
LPGDVAAAVDVALACADAVAAAEVVLGGVFVVDFAVFPAGSLQEAKQNTKSADIISTKILLYVARFTFRRMFVCFCAMLIKLPSSPNAIDLL